jgi:hypothetical protein
MGQQTRKDEVLSVSRVDVASYLALHKLMTRSDSPTYRALDKVDPELAKKTFKGEQRVFRVGLQ